MDREMRKAEDSGSALLVALAILLIVTFLAIGLIMHMEIEQKLARNYLARIDAFYLAETGINRALQVCRDDSTSIQTALENSGIPSFGSPVYEGSNRLYEVLVVDDDDGDSDATVDTNGIVYIRSTGTTFPSLLASFRSRRTIEVKISYKGVTVFTPPHAIHSNSDLSISESLQLSGESGSVHGQENVTITGKDIVIAGPVTSVAAYDWKNKGGVYMKDDITVEGLLLDTKAKRQNYCQSHSGAASDPAPAVVPSDYSSLAQYVMETDGHIYDLSTSPATDLGTSWGGWEKQPGLLWRANSDSMTHGIFYAKGDLELTTDHGSTSDPNWQATLIAEGSIEVHSSCEAGIDSHPDAQNLLFVAGTDITIGGSDLQEFNGVILAHEQVEVKGDPVLNGAILIEGAASTDSLVTGNDIRAPQIAYDGLTIPLAAKDGIAILSWREDRPE